MEVEETVLDIHNVSSLRHNHGSFTAYVETAVLQLGYNETMKKKNYSCRRILKGETKTQKP